VQARPGERFTGRVEQVRLSSTTLENVVSYGVVVSVENPEGKLLPGMTARVEFLVDRAQGVLRVPNAALRFRPEPEAAADAEPQRRGAGAAATRRDGQLWTVDKGGRPQPLPVRVGLTDGVTTQVEGAGIAPGLRVIAGVQRESSSAPAANPFQPQRGGGTRRPGGGF
jgi:HlyD family secretion protein